MARCLFIFFSVLMYQIPMFANFIEETKGFSAYDSLPGYNKCFIDIVSKVYVNPERIFCEDGKYYLSIDDDKIFYVSNLQSDMKGYFIEINSSTPQNDQLNEFMLQYTKHLDQRCPLCGCDGYFAGRCKNKDCPGKENKRRAEEEKQKKKDEYKRKKNEEKRKK